MYWNEKFQLLKNHLFLFCLFVSTEQAWNHGGLRTRELGQGWKMWNVKSERTKIRQFASLCTAHCQSGTTDNIVSLCCYFYVYTFLRHYKVQTKKDKSNYYLKFHKFTKKCFVIKHFNIQGRSQRGCKGGSLVPPDFSKNIEVKNGRYFAFANYGNTGCGVFKRGVQN